MRRWPFDAAAWARQNGIDPAFDLPARDERTPPAKARLQTLLLPEQLDKRLKFTVHVQREESLLRPVLKPVGAKDEEVIDWKGKTFRLSNMGDETKESIAELLAALDDCLAG